MVCLPYRLLLLRPSSSNKVNEQEFYIKGFNSDKSFHQTWVTQITLHNLLQGNKPYMQHTNGAEFNLWYFVPSISLKKQSADAFVADS